MEKKWKRGNLKNWRWLLGPDGTFTFCCRKSYHRFVGENGQYWYNGKYDLQSLSLTILSQCPLSWTVKALVTEPHSSCLSIGLALSSRAWKKRKFFSPTFKRGDILLKYITKDWKKTFKCMIVHTPTCYLDVCRIKNF